MDSLFRANFNEHDRIALDCEVAGGNSKSTITNITLQCMNIIKQRTGRYPIIYSRASWVNPYLDVTALPSETDWWLANYLSPRPYPLYTPEMTRHRCYQEELQMANSSDSRKGEWLLLWSCKPLCRYRQVEYFE